MEEKLVDATGPGERSGHRPFWRPTAGLGPGLLVTAAFIGPGTVTTASKAGAAYGLVLLWTVVFATAATIILQEMAARLGLVTRLGLGDVIRTTFNQPLLRWAVLALLLLAILFGNAAYQTGNLMGASLGLEMLGGATADTWVFAVTVVAALLLWTGAYRLIERVLVALVVVMSAVFVATAVIVRPDLAALAEGILRPAVPAGSLVVVIGMIGTTVVPYNLFLHASTVQQRWSASQPLAESLAAARRDTVLSITLGGAVTMSIVVTGAAAAQGQPVDSAAAMARQLEPLLGGSAARTLFAVGLFAAGMTSAVTAPLAAAYAAAGALGWNADLKSLPLRLVWLTVLATGAILAIALGRSPTETILIAQVANGLLLPIIAVLLLVSLNRAALLGPYANKLTTNLLGAAVALVATGLGLYHVLSRFRLFDL